MKKKEINFILLKNVKIYKGILVILRFLFQKNAIIMLTILKNKDKS
jgi:hypothetical protein